MFSNVCILLNFISILYLQVLGFSIGLTIFTIVVIGLIAFSYIHKTSM